MTKFEAINKWTGVGVDITALSMFDTKIVQIIDYEHANKHHNTRENNFVKSNEDFLRAKHLS